MADSPLNEPANPSRRRLLHNNQGHTHNNQHNNQGQVLHNHIGPSSLPVRKY